MKLVNRQKLIATAIILGITATPFASSPWLSASTAFAAEMDSASIAEVRTLGLMTGGTKGDFMPEKVLTRAEMAKILCNIFELDVNTASKTSYLDVSSTNWSAPYIEAVQAAGYMQGTGELFHPNQAVTRQELITSLVKAMDLHSETIDGSSPSAMDVARSYGLAIAENNTNDNAPLNRKTSADLLIQLLDHPVGQVDAQGDTVRVGNIPYRVNGDLQGLFGVENGTVLKGAKLDIDRSQRTVAHVNTIELNSNDGVFDGKGISFDGNLIVNGSVTLKNIQSTGNLQINGSGDSALTAQLSNSSWGNVVVSSINSIIQATGSSKIGKLTLNNTATVQTEGSASIQQLTIQKDLKQLTLNGNIDVLDASQYDGTPLVTLQPSAVIGNITLSKDRSASDVIRNYPAQKSAVSNINGSKNTDSTSGAATNSNTKKKDKDKNKNTEIIGLDVSRLLAGVNQANNLLHSKDMPELGEVPTLWQDMLVQAIDTAKGVLNQTENTQKDIDSAVEALNTAAELYASSQNALYSYYDLLMTVKQVPADYTDAGRFPFKEKLMTFAMDYYNPLTSKAQFDDYIASIAQMKAQFEQIKHVDFTELNLMLRNIENLSASLSNTEDAAKLMDMHKRYTGEMHKVMTQDEVNSLLQQLAEEFHASGLDQPIHSGGDYHDKLQSLTFEVHQLIYGQNDQLDRYMREEFLAINDVMNKAHMSLMDPDAPWTEEEAYNNLSAAWTTFKPAYDQKVRELHNSLSEQVNHIDAVMEEYGPYMPEYDAQQLKWQREAAVQLLGSDNASVSKLGYTLTLTNDILKNANLKNPTRLLAVIDQAKMEYEKYAAYHDEYYGQGSYKDNMNFYGVLGYAEALITSENARQSNLDEYEIKLKEALADYSTDWILPGMITNAVNNAHYNLDRAANTSDEYYLNLKHAAEQMESRSTTISFPELRELYINLVETNRAYEQRPTEGSEEPVSSIPGEDSETSAPTPNPSAPPVSETEETPASETETAPAAEEPAAETTPDTGSEPTSQPVDNSQPSGFEPADQHYDYSAPPQNNEAEAAAPTPVVAAEPETTEAP